MPCLEFKSLACRSGCLQTGNCVSFGILQNRSSICGLRAKKCSGYCVTSAGIGYCSMSLRSCDWFRNQDFFTSSLRSSDGRFQLPVLSPLAGRHSHSVLGHTLVENLRFSPLSRSPAGISSAELNARHTPMRATKVFNVRLCAKVLWLPFWVEMQWSFPQRVVAYQHTAAHLRIMHAHLAFCRYLCKFNGALCIYNGALIDLSNFWYIGLLEKKVNRCVLVTIPTLTQVVPFCSLSLMKGKCLSAGGTGQL